MTLGELKRRLYAGNRPGRIATVLNRFWGRIHALGFLPNYLVTLEVEGRRTGHPVSLPLVMAVVDGERYLVSMLGTEAGWVRNVEAAGGVATMVHGRRERVRLLRVPIEERPRIIKAYLNRAPGARPHIPVDKDAALDAFIGIAPTTPVYRVANPAESVSPQPR
jgi:deazaflavin-dependent oxidoreductase (nitroreductase family)